MANELDDGMTVSRSTNYGRFGIISCAVVVCFVVMVVVLILASLYRTPYIRKLAECRLGIEQVGAALQRYSTKNDEYPEKLSDLVPEYIPAKTLHCPADEPPSSGAISYKYTRLRPNSPEKAILLSCRHHKLKASMPAVTLQYLKNGQVVMVNEGK